VVAIALAMVVSVLGVMNTVSAAGAGEQFLGYDLAAGKWQKADLGKGYSEGDWVSYQLKIQDNSPIWGNDFDIRYNFHQASSGAIYVDGFDASLATGFQYTYTSDFLPDGQEVPTAGWDGHHIQTQATGDPISTVPQITHYMDPWPAGSGDGTPPGSDPSLERYFTVSGLPWEDFTGGYVILFFRAHLALSIIWTNGLESALPQELDGNVFHSWTAPWEGSSAATGSSRHFYLEYPGVGSKTIPIPIAQYPSTAIHGHKYLGGALYDGWEITLNGLVTLGPDLPPIPYMPPSVMTGSGFHSSGAAWSTGYFEFVGLVSGTYNISEEDRAGFGHYDIVVGGAATNVVENVAEGWTSFDLESGADATVDFYNSAATETTTLLSAFSITLGESVYDTATVTSDGSTPTGDVQFYVRYEDEAWAPLDTPVSLVDGEAMSVLYSPMSAGEYWFKAAYLGSPDFAASESGDTDEPLSVEPATPTVTTLLSDDSVTLGDTVYDTVTALGLGGSFPTPTGDVQFYVKVGDGVWTALGATVSLVGGQAVSAEYTPLAAGSYWFKATYMGDSNYVVASSGETEEPLAVEPATPVVATLLSDDSITLGESVYDTVTVSGLDTPFPGPTGTVQFYVKVDAGAWAALGDPVLLVSGQATSIDYTPLTAGDYWFKAGYSGDANYVAGQSGEMDEPLSIGRATPAATTLLSDDSITLGESVYDTVTVIGLGGEFPIPTGTVQFYVKVDGGVWTALGSSVTLVEGHATSIDYTPLAAGSYWFKAEYSGDANYIGAQSGETDEPLQVWPSTPTVATLLSDDSITLGGTVYDTVTVSGLTYPFPAPTGTVQFYVKMGVGEWIPLGAPVALVDGHAMSIVYTPLEAGSYWFKATYSGDSNYVSASSGETDEPLTVGPATPVVTTILSASSITWGQSVHDRAIVTGLGGAYPMPTGTVQFYVKVGTGSWEALGISVPLVNGEVSSIDYTPASGGTYWFKATYSGDSNYVSASSGETEEPLTVISGATKTVGYWKTHPSKWAGIEPNDPFPWTAGRAAGKTYMQILKLAPRGDATIILAYQYIAAVLNANAFGAPADVMDMIAHAEYLFEHGYPVGSDPSTSDPVRSEIISLAAELDAYNNSGDY